MAACSHLGSHLTKFSLLLCRKHGSLSLSVAYHRSEKKYLVINAHLRKCFLFTSTLISPPPFVAIMHTPNSQPAWSCMALPHTRPVHVGVPLIASNSRYSTVMLIMPWGVDGYAVTSVICCRKVGNMVIKPEAGRRHLPHPPGALSTSLQGLAGLCGAGRGRERLDTGQARSSSCFWRDVRVFCLLGQWIVLKCLH